MPAFGLVFLFDGFFIVHVARTGRFQTLAYVIFFLPVVGAVAYLFIEVLPEYRFSP